MKKKLKIQEGDVFSYPINDDLFGIGLVLRINGMIMLSVFFDPKFVNQDSNVLKLDLSKQVIFFTCLCSALGIKNSRWKILGKLESWDKRQWPIPVFKRKDSLSGEYSKVFYNENLEETNCIEVESGAVTIIDCPDDGLAGYGYVESKMKKLLNLK